MSSWPWLAEFLRTFRKELACRYPDEKRYFVSESSVYRILKAADLITSPAYILLSASDAFKNPTTRVHEMWQTDFTYFRIIGSSDTRSQHTDASHKTQVPRRSLWQMSRGKTTI